MDASGVSELPLLLPCKVQRVEYNYVEKIVEVPHIVYEARPHTAAELTCLAEFAAVCPFMCCCARLPAL